MKRRRQSVQPKGGMLDTPAVTPPGFARYLRNAFPRAGSWVWRAGAAKLHAVQYSDGLAWAGANKTTGPGTPSYTLLAASTGTSTIAAVFLRLVGAALVPIPYNGTAGPSGVGIETWRAWEDAPVSDSVRYACRRSAASLLYNVQETQVTAAGIDAPAAPTVVDSAGAGALPGGDYPVSYRYFTSDGMFSPWSEPIVVTIGASKKRAWTIANSTHPRVIGKQLGVGFPSGDVRNVYVAYTVNDNTTTAVEEEKLPEEYDIEQPADFDVDVPPLNPEDVSRWDAKLWVVSNNPRPLIWPSTIDATGASIWELFNPLEALEIPNSGDRRAQGFKGWDRTRAVAMTDGSAHLVEPNASGYSVETIDENHGCVSAAAFDVGSGYLAWFDGRNLVASRGAPGDAQIVSRGWVDVLLSQVPTAYANRAVVKWVPDDGGAFWLSVPSTSSSTAPDIVLCWRPAENDWHVRDYFGGGHAPRFLAQIPSPDAGQYTVACFQTDPRVMRVDSPTRRDEGPFNIQATIEFWNEPIPDGYAVVAINRVHIGVRRRADSALADTGATITADVSLKVNGVQTTPVSVPLTSGAEFISALAQNMSSPASDVTVLAEFDHPDPLEIFELVTEATFYQREMART